MFASIGMIGQWRRPLCLGLLAMAPLALSGCFGGFPMSKAVFHGNRNVYSSVEGDRTQRKMAQSVVMWVFIPVYAGAAVGDMVVFNLIEFWTGTRTEVSYNQEANGTKVAVAPSKDGREAVLTISRDGKLLTEQHVTKVSANVFELRDASGTLAGTIQKAPRGTGVAAQPQS